MKVIYSQSLDNADDDSSTSSAPDPELDKINAIIERALRDGRLSRAERDTIMVAVYRDRHITPEKCALLRVLQDKIWRMEVLID